MPVWNEQLKLKLMVTVYELSGATAPNWSHVAKALNTVSGTDVSSQAAKTQFYTIRRQFSDELDAFLNTNKRSSQPGFPKTAGNRVTKRVPRRRRQKELHDPDAVDDEDYFAESSTQKARATHTEELHGVSKEQQAAVEESVKQEGNVCHLPLDKADWFDGLP